MVTKEYNCEPHLSAAVLFGLNEAFSLFIQKKLYTVFHKLFKNVSSGCNKPLSAVSHCWCARWSSNNIYRYWTCATIMDVLQQTQLTSKVICQYVPATSSCNCLMGSVRTRSLLEMISYLKSERAYLKCNVSFQFRGSKVTDTAQSIMVKARPAWVTQRSDNSGGTETVRLCLYSNSEFWNVWICNL